MLAPIVHIEPDPLPTVWNYELASNFARDGVPAKWAAGSPHIWGSEDVAIPIDGGQPSRLAVSHDDRFLAVGCMHSIEIYDNVTGAKRFSIHPTPRDWKVNHVEWRRTEGAESRTYQLVICVTGRHPGSNHRKGNAYTQVYSLDVEDWRSSVEPALLFPCFPWPLRSLSMLDSTAANLLVLSQAQAGPSGPGAPHSPTGQVEVCLFRDLKSTTLYHCSLSLLYGSDSAQTRVQSAWHRLMKYCDSLTPSRGALRHSTEPLGGEIRCVAFSPDGDKVACTHAGANISVRVFGTDGRFLQSIAFQALTRSLTWSPDSTILAFGAQGGALQLYDWKLQAVSQTWRLNYPGIRPSALNEPTQLQFIDDGRMLLFATGQEGGVEVYNLHSNLKERYQPGPESNFVRGTRRSAIAWSPTRRAVISLDGDGVLRFWKV